MHANLRTHWSERHGVVFVTQTRTHTRKCTLRASIAQAHSCRGNTQISWIKYSAFRAVLEEGCFSNRVLSSWIVSRRIYENKQFVIFPITNVRIKSVLILFPPQLFFFFNDCFLWIVSASSRVFDNHECPVICLGDFDAWHPNHSSCWSQVWCCQTLFRDTWVSC